MADSDGKFYLLLGAGFSRNWGGWLASEVEEYLLSLPALGPVVRSQLLECRARGGFEKALANLASNDNTRHEFESLQDALAKMFQSMDQSFASPAFKFEISNNIKELVSRFLCRFDAIFSLNQDLLLERHYFQQVLMMSRDVGRSWNGCASPGLTPIPNASYSPAVSQWKPTDWDGQPSPNIQPYIKLHGSSNWLAPDNGRLLIMGENKSTQISNQNLLQKYQDYFRRCLCGPNARLMVIGFSFEDFHIYQTILDGVSQSGLKVFIVDPMGLDVLDKRRDLIATGIYERDKNFGTMWSSIIGASRRPFRDALANDHVEREKYETFFL